jgi:hypothetical protein
MIIFGFYKSTSLKDNKYISEMEGIITAKEFQVFGKNFY